MVAHFEDKKLVKQLLVGDERAFNRFFDENFARLYRFALTRLSDDPEAAREVAQVTLTRAVQKLASYRAESALYTWLCAICRNETSEWLRRQGRYREHVVLTEDYPEIRAAVDSFAAAEQMRPEYNYRRAERLRLIGVALDSIPARYGDILEWKYIEGRSVKEIAGRLDIGTEAAQSLLARARRSFADVYSSLAAGLAQSET